MDNSNSNLIHEDSENSDDDDDSDSDDDSDDGDSAIDAILAEAVQRLRS